MLFNIETELDHFISGYVVPDTFAGQCEIVVNRNGEELLRKLASDPREALRMAGRHETGLCGFTITEADVPGLADLPEFEIVEPETGIMIHRRCNLASVVHRQIFRLETQLLPLNRFDRALQPRFQLYYPLIDRFGLETNNQVFLMRRESVYVSGRLNYRSLEANFLAGFSAIALIQDPFEEMAERILVMRLMADGYKSYFGMRDAVVFEEAIAFSAGLSLEDDRDLKRAFRDVPPAVEDVFGDPLLRQLTTRLPGEAVSPGALGSALNTLASFSVVGLRHRSQLFTEAVADLFSLDPAELPAIDQIPATKALAERLRRFASAEALVENDLALFEYVRGAFEKPGTAG